MIITQLRFVNFDTNYLSQIPYIFKSFEPFIISIKDCILWSNSFIGLPWWCVLGLSALAVRLIIFPLILVQMKRFSKIAPISPVLVFLKEGWAHS
jgi:membrane protein insertase Oxa1/YidC/SpoIIIJ